MEIPSGGARGHAVVDVRRGRKITLAEWGTLKARWATLLTGKLVLRNFKRRPVELGKYPPSPTVGGALEATPIRHAKPVQRSLEVESAVCNLGCCFCCCAGYERA